MIMVDGTELTGAAAVLRISAEVYARENHWTSYCRHAWYARLCERAYDFVAHRRAWISRVLTPSQMCAADVGKRGDNIFRPSVSLRENIRTEAPSSPTKIQNNNTK
jgi:hypothetical protein